MNQFNAPPKAAVGGCAYALLFNGCGILTTAAPGSCSRDGAGITVR
jgi:hypothetical protein